MTNDVQTLLGAVRNTAEKRIAGGAARIDRERAFPDENLRALGEIGALGLVVPTEYGGAGGALTALAEACETVGSACASTWDGVPDALRHSRDRRGRRRSSRGRHAGAMASGADLGTLAFSERGTGAHFYSPELKATRSSGSVKLSGRKSFVTSGGHADVYLVLVQGEAEGAADAYLLPGDREGVHAGRLMEGLGMAGNSSVALDLDDVELDPDDLIGAPGEGIDLVFNAVAPFFLVGLAAVNVGIAAAAARRRQRSMRRTGATRTAPRWRRCSTCSTCSPTWTGDAAGPRCSCRRRRDSAKRATSRRSSRSWRQRSSRPRRPPTVTQIALEATGGQGYTPALPIERHLRDARAGCGHGADERRAAQLDRQGARGAPGAMSGRDSFWSEQSPITRGSSRSGNGFRDYFAAPGAPTDYVLYSNYERLVEALLDGEVDIGWNTNTAYVAAEERIGGDAQAARDARRRRGLPHRDRRPGAARLRLAPRSWPANGSHSAAGTRATRRSCRSTTSTGKGSKIGEDASCSVRHRPRQARRHRRLGAPRRRAVARGDADAGALGDATWAAMRVGRASRRQPSSRSSWRSPTYYHCNFTALPSLRRGSRQPLERGAARDELRRAGAPEAMDLEGVKRGCPATRQAMPTSTEAMREQGYLG